MSLTSEIYGVRHNGRSHGDVFTSPAMVRFMLDKSGYTPDKDLSKYTILEPSCGTGDFLLEIQSRIIASADRYAFDATEIMQSNVYACDIDGNKIATCIRELQTQMPEYSPINVRNEDFLCSIWDKKFDFVVGNPPYVRYENIQADKRELYKRKFNTFHYRCDLYVLFYEHSLALLKPGGTHCFICSNRWLKNEYGKKLRNLVASAYSLTMLVDAEGADVFDEDVLAYPAISVIRNTPETSVVQMAKIDEVSALYRDIDYRSVASPTCGDWSVLFSDTDISSLSSITGQGYTIGIGVATGADKIFISSKFDHAVEPELLLPLINAKDLTANRLEWGGGYLLNPYDSYGRLINIDDYPKAKSYLESHRDELSQRHIVKNNRAWYSLIDKIKPGLRRLPKVLLPDISGNRVIFVDDGQFYPAHNIYYITGKSKQELEVLAAILMSSFVKTQISNISNKMNGGLPRWQSQSIRKLRIPVISDIDATIGDALLHAYHNRHFKQIDEIVERLVSETVLHKNTPMPHTRHRTLFDELYA